MQNSCFVLKKRKVLGSLGDTFLGLIRPKRWFAETGKARKQDCRNVFSPWLAKSCTRVGFLAIGCVPCPGSGSPDPSSTLNPIQISIWTSQRRVHRPAGLTLVTEKAPQFSEDQPHHEPGTGQTPWAALGGRCRGAHSGTEGKPTRSRGASRVQRSFGPPRSQEPPQTPLFAAR